MNESARAVALPWLNQPMTRCARNYPLDSGISTQKNDRGITADGRFGEVQRFTSDT
jgi:hypothetical protein